MNKKLFYLVLGSLFAFIGATSTFAASPIVQTTVPVTSVTTTSAVISGSYDIGTATGGATVWFNWGTTPSLDNETTYVNYSQSSRTFSATLTGLVPGAIYYYQAFATNVNVGPGYGATKSFTTESVIVPTIQTMGSTPTATTANLKGYFIGNSVQTQFIWGTNSTNLNHSTGFVTQSGTSGTFSEIISGLTPSTTYYYRAVGKNYAGTEYGEVVILKTPASNSSTCSPTLTADETTVAHGASTVLRWNISGCGMPELSSTNGTYDDTSVEGYTSRTSGAISGTTTFTLSAIDLAGNRIVSNAVTIYVSGGGTTIGNCQILSFYPYSYNVAYNTSTTLAWETTGNCVSLYIDNGIGSIGSSLIPEGTRSTNNLTSSRTFTLTATDANGATKTRGATVTVSTTEDRDTWYNPTTCYINYFNASQTNVVQGGSTNLSWSSTGCSYVTISGLGSSGSYLPANGSYPVSGLYYTTTYAIYGYGSSGNTTGQSVTVYVSGNNQPYYPPTQQNPNSNVVTTVATNIGNTTARLNGLIINAPSGVNAHFEYGTSPSFQGIATSAQTVVGNAMNFYTSINVFPLTTYYYRAVAVTNGVYSYGSVVSFTTPSKNSTPVTYYENTPSNSGTKTSVSGVGTSTTGGVLLEIKNKSDKINVGDVVEYTLSYTNGSTKTLKNSILTIVFPAGLTAKQATQGRMVSPSTIEVNLGTLAPSQSGSIFLEANVDQNVSLSQTLVTTATLNFTLPDGSRDSAVGYILNHAGAMGSLGGIALGTGFFPTTIFGWLITVLVILALVLVARRIAKASANHGGGGHH